MVNLGDKVKDSITRFKGIAVASYNYITGCTRISVQPKADKDVKMKDANTFDEPTLIVVNVKKRYLNLKLQKKMVVQHCVQIIEYNLFSIINNMERL